MIGRLDDRALESETLPPDFELRRVIGRGTGSLVLEAQHRPTGKLVALTQLDTDPVAPEVCARFLRECVAVAELGGHPHIVTIHDMGRHGRQLWIAMELCPAGSLADRLAQHGPSAAPDAADVLAKIAAALDAAHRKGVVHCDVKLANIMITESDEPVLRDFGVARLRAGGDSAPTVGGSVLDHVPPEVIRGDPGSAAGDVYSLGMSVWQLIEGRPPFTRVGDSGAAAVVERILSEPLPPLTRTDVPHDLVALLAAMTAKDPGTRPAQLAAVADEAALIAARTRAEAGAPGAAAAPYGAEYPNKSDRIAEPFEVVAPEDLGMGWVAPRRRRVPLPAWSGARGRIARLIAAGSVFDLIIFGAVGIATVHSVASLDRAATVPHGVEVAPPGPVEAPPGTVDALPGVAPDPGDGSLVASPDLAAPDPGAPATPAAPGASAPSDLRVEPEAPRAAAEAPGDAEAPADATGSQPHPAERGPATVTGSHVLAQRLSGDCTESAFWQIKGPFTLTTAPDGAVSGRSSGRGSGSIPATCGGISGTLNWDHEYTIEFSGQVRDGVLSASGTMLDTDRTTAAGCSRDGQPVECPSNPEAGQNRYQVTVSGRFDPPDGTGFGAMQVQMTRPTAGTWSVR